MKVEFSIDEFNRVYLLGASEILVRQARKVPAEDETMLGEFILRKITSAKRARKQSPSKLTYTSVPAEITPQASQKMEKISSTA